MTMSNEQQGKTGVDYTTEWEEKSTSSPLLILSKINDYTSTIKDDSNTQNYSFSTLKQQTNFYNTWADFWRYVIGVNVIPADTKSKTTHIKWKDYQNNAIPPWTHEKWKKEGDFNSGMAIILGRIWHNQPKTPLYLNAIDVDNLIAIKEICSQNGKNISISELAKWTLVEQHIDSLDKMHVLIYSHRHFIKKSSNKTSNHEVISRINSNELPAIEVKSTDSILFCSPSVHQNGHPYQIMGTLEPVIADEFGNHIDNICRKYSIPYLETVGSKNGKALTPIQELFKPDFAVYEGHNRHE